MSDCETLETLKREVVLRTWNCIQPFKYPFIHIFHIFSFVFVFLTKKVDDLDSGLRKLLKALLRSFICWSFSSRVDGENSWIIASRTAVLFRLKIRAFLSRMFLASSVRRKLMVFFITATSFWRICNTKRNTLSSKSFIIGVEDGKG